MYKQIINILLLVLDNKGNRVLSLFLSSYFLCNTYTVFIIFKYFHMSNNICQVVILITILVAYVIAISFTLYTP